MATKIKGIYKGFKYFTQIFVVKDNNRSDMEIGYPTDVKHVAHIGWDGPNGTTGPTWMNEFKTAPDFSTSIGSLSQRRDPNPTVVTTSGSTRDFEDSKGNQPTPIMYQDMPNLAGATHHVHKKHKRKKPKSTSSPKSRQSRASRSKANMYCELESAQNCPTIIAAGSRH